MTKTTKITKFYFTKKKPKTGVKIRETLNFKQYAVGDDIYIVRKKGGPFKPKSLIETDRRKHTTNALSKS